MSAATAQAPPAETLPRADSADVALLLEGTYPYVAGGVSSWVHQIIRGFPELRFALIFIGSLAKDYGRMRYELPANVVHVEVHYLFERTTVPPIQTLHGDAEIFEKLERLHEYFRAPQAHGANEALLGELVGELNGRLDHDQFLYSEAAWQFILQQYRQYCTDPSFVDYFWTVRTMHAPLWVLSRICESMLPVRAFHSVSTGYAGFLGAMLKRRYGKPLILSEHGIYTKERKIDLFSAQWIADTRSVFQRDPTELSYFKQMWIRFFEAFGKACYDAADSIIALYETNRLRQVADGADPARTRNIPNGISLATFGPLRHQRPPVIPKVLCLIGRVVPIKDVKTFIRAMHSVVQRMPEAQGWIAGPEEEDPGYAAECHALVESLSLGDGVKFLVFQRLTDLLPKIGVVVLSSISEALPLVLLEGYAAGVPGISTDVGSCRQLIFGLSEEDRALGASGRVVGVADPQALAAAAIELLGNEAEWRSASAAGIQRVEKYYTQDLMFASYREVYEKALLAPAGRPPGGPAENGANAKSGVCPVAQGKRQ